MFHDVSTSKHKKCITKLVMYISLKSLQLRYKKPIWRLRSNHIFLILKSQLSHCKYYDRTNCCLLDTLFASNRQTHLLNVLQGHIRSMWWFTLYKSHDAKVMHHGYKFHAQIVKTTLVAVLNLMRLNSVRYGQHPFVFVLFLFM